MNFQLANDYNATRSLSVHDTFCRAPSVNMYFSQNGEVKVCCHNTQFTIGTYPQQSINEIWNSEKAEELRGYMKKYDLLHGCEVCDFDLKLRGFNEVPAKHFDSLPRNSHYPAMMEFLLSNTCNLECVMCRGEFSSLIRKNREKLPPLHSTYDNEFLKQLEEFIPHLHETRFSGSGEAFSIDMNYEIWEMILKLNPRCTIMIQTNGTILTDRVKNILERGNFQIGVSLDSVNKDNYEAIRLNANFDKVIENIRWFSDYAERKKTHFMLAICVMRQNWHELPDFIKLCNDLNAYSILHKVWFPVAYALHNLPSAELNKIHDSLSIFDYMPQSPLQKANLNQYRYFLSVIKNWKEGSAEREKKVQNLEKLSVEQLLELIAEKIQNHVRRMELSEVEKSNLVAICLEKLKKVLNIVAPGEKKAVLQLLYQENPAKVIEPLKEQTVETLHESAKKFLNANAFTTQ